MYRFCKQAHGKLKLTICQNEIAPLSGIVLIVSFDVISFMSLKSQKTSSKLNSYE